MIFLNVSYRPLWEKIDETGMKKAELWRLAKISASTCQKLRNNEHVTTTILLRICEVLNCDISEVIEFV